MGIGLRDSGEEGGGGAREAEGAEEGLGEWVPVVRGQHEEPVAADDGGEGEGEGGEWE